MNNNELLIEKYKELEYAITKRYNLPKGASPIPYLESRNDFSKYAKELSYCREVRNFLQHENKINQEFAVIASDEMINKIEEIIEVVNNPVRIKDVYIKLDNVYYKGLGNYVYPSMVSMDHKRYSHIPIVENRKLVGVFSKTSIFKYLLEEDMNILDNDLRFIDINKYISLDEEYYLYTTLNEPVGEVVEEVISNFKQGKRIAMIFVTKDGTDNGELLGLLTPYDILGY